MANKLKNRLNNSARAIGLVTGSIVLSSVSMSAMAEMELGKVNISGYLDMSVGQTDTDGQQDVKNAGLDRAEVRFKSQLDEKLSIEAHVAGGADEDYDLEQAHFVYAVCDKLSVKAGKYLSALGWEAFHAPDLYQYSTSATLVYPGMMNGAAVSYQGEGYMVYGSAMSSAWDSTDNNRENGMAYEGAVKFTAIENVTAFLGYATETMNKDLVTEFDRSLVNLWVSYAAGPLTVAAEFNDLSEWSDKNQDGDGWLVMANYKITDDFSVTARTSALNLDATAANDGSEVEKYTLAGLYSVNANLSLVVEYSSSTAETEVFGISTTTEADTDQFTIEAIVTF